ncbi:MAG: ABC transporter ATP-binding protein [Planctomycetes bacterium]|nr:ABC transporter ATP-binding protein [Planctomycetota bacterium]
MAGDAPISLRGVTRTFGSGSAAVQALRGINLEVPDGELFMLVGPSGCGKTTLISIVAGILRQDAGSVRLLGEDLARLPGRLQADFRARNVGFVFQQFNLVPTLTVQENVALPLQIAGWRRRRAMDRAAATLALVGLEARLDAPPDSLSGGQQQRVAIARAIVHDPRILVCDEPTSALDREKGRQVMDLLRAIAIRPGRALIVVTHDTRVFGYSDRIATMQDGHIVRLVRRRFDPATAATAEPAPATVPL